MDMDTIVTTTRVVLSAVQQRYARYYMDPQGEVRSTCVHVTIASIHGGGCTTSRRCHGRCVPLQVLPSHGLLLTTQRHTTLDTAGAACIAWVYTA